MSDVPFLMSSFAPRWQVEHKTRMFDTSSFPPSLLGLILPILNLTLRPVSSSMSPGMVPHIRQESSSCSRIALRNSAEIPLPNATSHCSPTCLECGPSVRRALRHRLIGLGRLSLYIHILLAASCRFPGNSERCPPCLGGEPDVVLKRRSDSENMWVRSK